MPAGHSHNALSDYYENNELCINRRAARPPRQDEAEREKGHVPSFPIVTACIWHVYAPTRTYTEFVIVDLGVAGMKKEKGQSARNA